MRFVWGGALSNQAYKYHDVLTALGQNFTLGSYFYFRTKPQDHCKHYVLTGTERHEVCVRNEPEMGAG